MEQILENVRVFSCPSKVLIMGGYAILSQECVGLSVGLNERFYALVSKNNCSKSVNNGEDISATVIDDDDDEINGSVSFVSAQIESQWKYKINRDGKGIIDCSELANPFLESVVAVIAGEGLFDKQFGNLNVQIYHDNRFYSKQSQLDLADTRRFRVFNKKQLNKTGLGSSACVIVACLGTLLNALTNVQQHDPALLHKLAQKANYLAQKKIGSGFDIATSVFGSQIYTRFPPNIFQQDSKDEFNWGNYTRFHVPKELQVVMIDLQMGSDTRVLAGNVKKYLDANPTEANEFFKANNDHARELQDIFMKINSLESLQVERQQIARLNQSYRQVFKKIGQLSGVDTEPDALTTILDKIVQQIQKVYYAVCPGAGGFDAICLLVESTMTVSEIDAHIQQILKEQTDIQSMTLEVMDVSLEGFSELSFDKRTEFLNSLKEIK